ncbi:Arc family DNA-binding protein [Pectobacterium polaris]|uniref:Arc family DNA-binding protein n=1 Tax=Pectobacterium polaris TaxID=2042057 RepID=UPI001CF26342|nr:Arc family DNA-binding protein [Pectobacterium polaris]MCA6954647.1 Arc family DNA-binding protein [Pectobacterium polaris]
MARDEPKVNIRLPQEMKDKLHALAEKNKRSVNAEVVAAIEEALIKDKMNDSEIPGSGGMMAKANEFMTPRRVLEEIARMAAREALSLEKSKKEDKG